MKRYLFVFQNIGENLIAKHQMEYYFDSIDEIFDFIKNGNSFISSDSIKPISLFEIEDISEYLKSMKKDIDISNKISIPIVKASEEIELQ